MRERVIAERMAGFDDRACDAWAAFHVCAASEECRFDAQLVERLQEAGRLVARAVVER